jgi:uncharacterized protein
MRQRTIRIAAATAGGLILLVVLGGAAARLYTDLLWYDQLGYTSVLQRRIVALALVRLLAAGVAAAIVLVNLWLVVRQIGPVHVRRRFANLEIAEQIPHATIRAGIVGVALLTGLWLAASVFSGPAVLGIVGWLNAPAFGVAEPYFGRDVGFYVFTLPVLNRTLGFLLITLLWSGVLALAGYVLVGAVRLRGARPEVADPARVHLAAVAAAVIVLFAVRFWLGRYGVLLEGTGFTGTLGFTDVHARLPARWLISGLLVALAAALVWGAARRQWVAPAAAGGFLLIAVVVAGGIYPAMLQKLRVEPNQLGREAGYIEWHMDFTRRAYGLTALRREQLPVGGAAGGLAEIRTWLDRLPLWDREPLGEIFNTLYPLQAYYQFPNVDFDRYGPPGGEQQVGIAVREFNRDGLPLAAQTWQTLHLNPDHVRGRGIVVTSASASGRADPDLWVGDLPVQRDPAAPQELELTEPSVYFGETMTDYIVLGAAVETDAAAPGAEHGATGIALSSFGRVLAFAWRFGDRNLIFATELQRDSRLVFRRGIRERVAHLAPFLAWDPDPYPVVHRGRIVWILDGYTVTSRFPLAHESRVEGVGRLRYLRNSVKATVDGVTGEVRFYMADEADPIVLAYAAAYPTLMRPLDDMPAELRRHLRYPALLFRLQAEILRNYHLDRPEAFYAGQELWELPDERVGQAVARPYRPMYMMTRLPGERRVEFVAMMPFLARQRETMTSLIVARSDPPHYGELLLLELPREHPFRGPTLFKTLVEQDPDIAPQLSLWRQTSDVRLGQVRVVPLEGMILYVQPLYQSARGSPVPQLHRVIVGDGNAVRMEPTLAAAIAALAGQEQRTTAVSRGPAEADGAAVPAGPRQPWAREALELLEEADRRLRSGDWSGFGAVWEELQRTLQRANQGGPGR